MDLHNYKRRFERTLQRVEESNISVGNKEVIYQFRDYCLTQGISIGKVERYLTDIVKLSRMLKKPIKDAKKEDLMKVMAELNQGDLSESTKYGFKVMLRKLYRIIRGIDTKGEYPEEVKWVSLAVGANHKKLPEELLTDDK